jgi:hypothetical protein
MQYIKLEYLLKRKGSATRLAERSGVPQSHLTRWKQAGAIVEASTGIVYLPSATAHRLQVDEVMELAMGAPGGMTQKNFRDVQYTTGIADSLADALESLTSDYVSYRAVNGIDLTDDHSAALDVKMNLAIAALAAYWGEK